MSIKNFLLLVLAPRLAVPYAIHHKAEDWYLVEGREKHPLGFGKYRISYVNFKNNEDNVLVSTASVFKYRAFQKMLRLLIEWDIDLQLK